MPHFHRSFRTGLSLAACLFGVATAGAQAPAVGGIAGRVFNVTSDSFLNNARITVAGRHLEVFSDETGEYRLSGLPAGEWTLTVFFTGLEPQTATVTVPTDRVVRRDFSLTRAAAPEEAKVIQLAEFVVAANREMNASAIAINEQRFASGVKNVSAAGEFGDISEGNLGEFVKYMPGVVVDYSGWDARTISLRGLPANFTGVTVDGNRVASAASSSVTRNFEVGGISMNNLARVEVTKVPTPDSPADTLGGSVNVVSKRAFERTRPLFTYRLYGNTNLRLITLAELPGYGPGTTTRRLHPGVDFSYVVPVNTTFGFTVSALHTQRFEATETSTATWMPLGANGNFGTAANPVLTSYSLQTSPAYVKRTSASISVDWKFRPADVLALSTQYSYTDFQQHIPNLAFNASGTTSSAAPVAYGPTFTQGAAGAGLVNCNPRYRGKSDATGFVSLAYRHEGTVWKFDGAATFSTSRNTYRDSDYGSFAETSFRLRSVTLRYDNINPTAPGIITGTTAAGVPVDVYHSNNFTLTNALVTPQSGRDTMTGARFNVRRDFGFVVPATLKAGVDVRRQDRDIRANTRTWTFVGPDGVATTADDLASRYDLLIDNGYNNRPTVFGFPRIQWPSLEKLWALYQEHPAYFRLDEVGAISGAASGSRKITETVSAAYLRADARLLANRLWLVGGVRFERTDDDGYGVLNDVRATYQQDANGNLVLDAAGRPIRLTSDTVLRARQQYKDRGAHAERNYDGGYPSLNAALNLTENLVARAAYARTLGRPNYSEIIPGISVSDPATTTRTITVNNTGLKPWTADNYDLSLEYYGTANGVVSVGAFRKDLADFFGDTRTPATLADLQSFGLTDDYLGYELISQNNVGDARITGVEFNCRQTLLFLPAWGRGVQVFVNGSRLHLQGANTADFSGFMRESYNWGVSLSRPRFTVKLNWNYRGRQRRGLLTGAAQPPGHADYFAPRDIVSLNYEVRLVKHVSLYGVINNLTNTANLQERYASGTPEYARRFITNEFGRQFSLGFKGEF